MKKRFLCVFMSLTMALTTPLAVSATTEEEVKAQRDASVNKLNNTNSTLQTLNEQQIALKNEISVMDADLVDLMVQIGEAEQDIETTAAQITETQAQLAAAQETRDQQYASMKKRIQYIYEEGGDAAWVKMLASADNLESLLNRAEYAQELHDYDRNMLNQYIATVDQIAQLEATLEQQKADLEASKAQLEVQQADLQVQLDAKRATSSDYDNQIEQMRQQAAQIQEMINQQNAEIARLERERIAREQAAAEAAAAAERAAAAASANSGSMTSSYYPDDTSNVNYSGGSSGSEIVAFAEQFVGCPYVWGGNSLTGGIDCSHFVWQVLMRCGVYSGDYTTSGGWRSLGRSVSSLSEAKAGDIICYSGHVAIYDGEGGIVEAKGSKWGITHNRSASHTTILAIRRFTAS